MQSNAEEFEHGLIYFMKGQEEYIEPVEDIKDFTIYTNQFPVGYIFIKIMESLKILHNFLDSKIEKCSIEKMSKIALDKVEITFNGLVYMSLFQCLKPMFMEYWKNYLNKCTRLDRWYFCLDAFLELCSSNRKYCDIKYLRILSAISGHALSNLEPELFASLPSQEDLIFLAAGNKQANKDDLKKIFDSCDALYPSLFNVYRSIEVNLSGLCYSSLQAVFMNGLIVKKCENCQGYFIPYNRSDTIYCDRKSPQDSSLTCKEYGSQRLWYQKLKENKAALLSRNVYSAKQMLVKRNPDIKEYRDSFEKFKSLSKQWKADVKAGTKTEEEFIEWLKSVKEKKVL